MFGRVTLPLIETAVGLLHYPIRWALLGFLGSLEVIARRFR